MPKVFFENRSTDKPDVQVIGKCIYCPKNNIKGLTREHVLPRALGGGLILRDAVCPRHRVMINEEIETQILDQWLGPFRRKFLGHRSKDKKRKVRTHPITISLPNGKKEQRLVSEADYPAFLHLPEAAEKAGLLRGVEPGPLSWKMNWFQHPVNQAEMIRLAKVAGGDVSFAVKAVPLPAFTRFLAKVALGTTVSRLGLRFHPLLLDLIEGRGLDQAGHLIGSLNVPWTIPGNGLTHWHRFYAMRLPEAFLSCVDIKFFSGFDTPSYTVVTGLFEAGTHPFFESSEATTSASVK